MGRVLTVTIKGKRSQEVRDGISGSKAVKSGVCAEGGTHWMMRCGLLLEEAWKLRAINLASVASESVPRGKQESFRNL